MRNRLMRSLVIVALLGASVRAGSAATPAAVQAARPLSTVEMAAAEGSLEAYQCFLLGLGIGIGCTLTGGWACAAAILMSAGTGGTDCLG